MLFIETPILKNLFSMKGCWLERIESIIDFGILLNSKQSPLRGKNSSNDGFAFHHYDFDNNKNMFGHDSWKKNGK